MFEQKKKKIMIIINTVPNTLIYPLRIKLKPFVIEKLLFSLI